MTDFADFKTQIAEWSNRGDWSDALVTSFIRSAEEKFNEELLIDRMMKVTINTVDHECADLPDDWIKADLMLIQATSSPYGWTPIRYQPADEFFRFPNENSTTCGRYTIRGRTVYFGGPIDDLNGTPFRMHYYAEVPVFADDTPSWLYTKYPALYRYAALMHADLHAVGEEMTAIGLKALVEDEIKKLNDQHLLAKASGSRINRGRMRSFG